MQSLPNVASRKRSGEADPSEFSVIEQSSCAIAVRPHTAKLYLRVLYSMVSTNDVETQQNGECMNLKCVFLSLKELYDEYVRGTLCD